MNKSKVIIYGLGKHWKESREYLVRLFEIIAYSDRKVMDVDNYIKPEELGKYEYEYVYITSNQYFDAIKKELVEKNAVDEEKIIGEKNTCLYINNELVRDEWVKSKLKDIQEGKSLLDAGAGEMHYKKYCSHLKYISQDFGQYSGSTGRGGFTQKLGMH